MPARGQNADVNVSGDEARQQLIRLTPSTSPDGVLGLVGNHDRRISLQVKNAALVGDERGGVTAGPPNPPQSGDMDDCRLGRDARKLFCSLWA